MAQFVRGNKPNYFSPEIFRKLPLEKGYNIRNSSVREVNIVSSIPLSGKEKANYAPGKR